MGVKIKTEGSEEVVQEPATQETETVEGNLDSEESNEWDDLDAAFDEEGEGEDVVLQDDEPADQEEAEEEELPEETTAEGEEVESEVAEDLAETETETEEEVVIDEAPEATPEVTQEEYNEQVQSAREKATEELVTKFQLTEDQADDLVSDPNSVLPQLLANMYLDLFTNVMQGMHSQLPNMIQGVVSTTERESKQKNAFFTAWPQLNKAEHMKTVKRVGDNYSALNPKASRDDFIREVGAQAWVALRLPIEELLAHTGGGQAITQAENVTQLRSPASPGNATKAGVAPVKAVGNSFEMLADEFLDDDL